MQPLGQGGCHNIGRGRAVPPHLTCPFMQQNQMPFSSFILPLITFHFFYSKAWQLWVSRVSWCSRTGKAATCSGCGQAGGRAGRESAAPGSKTSWPGDTPQPVHWEKGWWFSDKTSLAAKYPVHYRDRGFLWELVIMLLLNYPVNCRNSKMCIRDRPISSACH